MDYKLEDMCLLVISSNIENLKGKIIKLKNDGLKNNDISNRLSTPLKTIERYITKIRSEGIL